MSATTPDELRSIYEKNPATFSDILFELENTTIDSRQLDILVRTRFFRQFGNTAELLKIIEYFRWLKNGNAKQVSTEELDKAQDRVAAIVRQYATCEGKNGNILKRWTILDCRKIMQGIEAEVLSWKMPERPMRELVADSIAYLGYIDLTTGKKEDRMRTVVTGILPMKSKKGDNWARKVTSVSLGTGRSAECTVYERQFLSKPLKEGDIIQINGVYKNERGYWYISDYTILSS